VTKNEELDKNRWGGELEPSQKMENQNGKTDINEVLHS
jgi:hypothetical protein